MFNVIKLDPNGIYDAYLRKSRADMELEKLKKKLAIFEKSLHQHAHPIKHCAHFYLPTFLFQTYPSA